MPRRAINSAMPILAVTLLAGAFLLFMVQPLMGAFVLPWFGGASITTRPRFVG